MILDWQFLSTPHPIIAHCHPQIAHFSSSFFAAARLCDSRGQRLKRGVELLLNVGGVIEPEVE